MPDLTLAELTQQRDEARADAGRAHGNAGALHARVMELRAQVTAREARIAELEAERALVHQRATEWAHQDTDYDEDTEQQIDDGRAILAILDSEPVPSWYAVARYPGPGHPPNIDDVYPTRDRASSEARELGEVHDADYRLYAVREVGRV